MMKPNPLSEIFARLGVPEPYAPSGAGPGWLPLVERTFKRLLEAGWRGQVGQVKQKFGRLVIYLDDAEALLPETKQQAREILSEATNSSLTTCEICGQPGVLRDDLSAWQTLCDQTLKSAGRVPLRDRVHLY